ncbi:MAG: LamG domain-containing protein [Phycisphaerae bacterium]|nr:LamG domain-containing protein [Phycisphaerae bacterium]
MCTRIMSRITIVTCLLSATVLALNTGPLAQKLPSQTWDKHPLAYFGFDQQGPRLRASLMPGQRMIQARGTRYTPEGLDQGALEFNGTTGQVRIPLAATQALTLSVWFLPTSYSNTGIFTACTLQSRQHTLKITLDAQGTIGIQQNTPFSQASSSLNMGRGIPANHWAHLALTATPGQMMLYLNGQCAGTFNMPVPLANANLQIADQTFKGKMDELALFGDRLSSQDIEAIYAMHGPSLNREVTQPLQDQSWEARTARTYYDLTQAVNSGNWSAAVTHSNALSELVGTYLKEHKTDLSESLNKPIQDNLTTATGRLKSFKEAIEQARYHEASDLFDSLDECWESLETQLDLPAPAMNAPMNPSGFSPENTQSTQFSQTWSTTSGTMPGNGFSGGSVSMGGTGSPGMSFGGSFSMGSSAGFGPNGPMNQQFQFHSSGTPGQGLMGQSLGQMPPQMLQFRIQMQCQRIQMGINILKMSLQNADWQTAQRHGLRLQQLFTQLDAPESPLTQPGRSARRRSLDLSSLPPAQLSALKTQVRNALHHLGLLTLAIEKQDLPAANLAIQSLEKVSTALNQMTNNTQTTPVAPPREPK